MPDEQVPGLRQVWEADLREQRRLLIRVQDHLHRQAILVADARELVARDSTWPRPRKEVDQELEKAVRFDVPMLLEEWIKTERRIAEVEREIAVSSMESP